MYVMYRLLQPRPECSFFAHLFVYACIEARLSCGERFAQQRDSFRVHCTIRGAYRQSLTMFRRLSST